MTKVVWNDEDYWPEDEFDCYWWEDMDWIDYDVEDCNNLYTNIDKEDDVDDISRKNKQDKNGNSCI